MPEYDADIRYFTAGEDDDFISGWYRVVDGRRIGDPLDPPPLPSVLFSPAVSAPVSPSFSGIFRQGIYADPTLGFNPFAQFDDIKVQVSQEISILNPIIDPTEDVSITIKGSKVHRVKVESTTLFSSTFIDDPRGTVEKKGHYGTLLFIPDDPEGASSGEWVYTLERRSRRVLDLNEGDTRKDFFTLVYGEVEELVVITVTGANDPYFFDEKSGYQFVVTEGIEIGTILGKPTGRDPEGDTPRFQIVGGNEDGLFHINPVSGWISVVGEIDFETTPYTSSYIGQFEYRNHFYNLQVEVSDGIAPPAQTTINIPVRDIDDTPPVIASTGTEVSIPADVAGFITDIEFTFTDVDTVFEGLDEIKWHISGDQADKFEIYRDPLAFHDGYRLQLKYLGGPQRSYEELDYGVDNTLSLTVQGEDLNGNISDPITIIVTILPPNLHAPSLTVIGNGAITEKIDGQDTGVTFSIADQDASYINQFSFNILDGKANQFEVVEINGIWTLKLKDGVSFDASKDTSVNVRLSVSDGVNSSPSETVKIDIIAVDEGDAKFFISNLKQIREAPEVGTVLTIIRGPDDPDGRIVGSTRFEWYHVGTPNQIIGRGQTYTVTEHDIGFQIHFRAIYIDIDGEVEKVKGNAGSVTGTVVAAEQTGDSANSGMARFYISNENQAREAPTPGTDLRALRGKLDPDGHDDQAQFQWFYLNAPDVVISTEKTYTVSNDDIGHRLMFRAFYTDGDGRAETVLLNTPSISGIVSASGYKNTLVVSGTTASITENAEGVVTDITFRLRDFLFNTLKINAHDFIITKLGLISDAALGNAAEFFEIIQIDGTWKLKLKDGVSLNYEDEATFSIAITVNNIPANDGEVLPSTTRTITINVVNVIEDAQIEIDAPNPAVISIGDKLTVSILAEDEHGLHATPNIAYQWFYVSDPDTAIGTGDSYIVKAADRGEKIGVERRYTDAQNNQDKVTDIMEIEVPRLDITPIETPLPSPSAPTPVIDTTITIAPQTASRVEAGDGSDTITDGNRNDIIIGGKGDDVIDLGYNQEGKDQDQVVYGIGDQSAKDGGDIITNFNRGRDSFIFSLEENSKTDAIDSLDEFLTYVMSGTPDAFHDDQLLVVLNLTTDDQGNVELPGLSFHFQDSVSFGGGRIAIPVVKVQFSETLDQQAIISALGGDKATALSSITSDGILTNLDYLDDLMGGEGSIGYIIDAL